MLPLLGGGGLGPDLLAQGTQRSTRGPSSSETNSTEIFSTLKALDRKDDGFERLDEELNKSLQPFTSRRVMDSALPSTYQVPRLPIAKGKRSREDLQKSRGWVWDAEEAVSGNSRADSSLFPGFTSSSSPDKKSSSWDQYSKNAGPDGSADRHSTSQRRSPVQNDDTSDEDAGLTGGIGEAAKSLNRTLKARLETESVGSIFNPPPTHSSALDFFGQPLDGGPTTAEIQAHKNYIDEYQKIIGSGALPASSLDKDFVKSATAAGQPSKSGGLDSLPGSSRHDIFAGTSGSTPTILLPAAVPDMNANVLNQWNPNYVPAQPEPPKPQSFFPPPVEVPRRKF